MPGPEHKQGADLSPDIDATVLEAFREVLGDPTIDLHSDFFAQGGDSMQAMLLLSTLQIELGTLLPTHTLFRCSTPLALAQAIREAAPREWPGSASPVPPVFS